jgi:NAD(P)-dependent dehydrogenase (short-subunit alcohol dehydrogenase family)
VHTVSKTWFITGTSRGLGRAFTEVALDRGDRVAATARDAATLTDLTDRYGDAVLPLALDVTDRAAATAAVQRAAEVFGRLDVVVNNAGYGHFGTVEELTEAELRDQVETNFFGAVWVTQAALPVLRAQTSGHIVQISSIGGLAGLANLGAYNASKWALEGITEALSNEVGALGIAVTLVEPGGYGTDWAGDSAQHSAPNPAYEPIRAAAAARRGGQAPGDPQGAAAALLELVDREQPPLRALFGGQALGIVSALYEKRLDTWRAGEDLARRAQG